MNLLLLFITAGVVSDAFLDSRTGENSLEYLAFLWSRANDSLPIALPFWNREDEGWSGVVILKLGSGRRVAMETRRLGLRSSVPVDRGGGLQAIDIRRGCIMVLGVFSLSLLVDATEKRFVMANFFAGAGDGRGMTLVILLNGSLSFEGPPNGGFPSVLFFSVSCFREKD